MKYKKVVSAFSALALTAATFCFASTSVYAEDSEPCVYKYGEGCYDTFKKAIDSIEDNATDRTIIVESDGILKYSTVSKDVTLDLNGKKLNNTNSYPIFQFGKNGQSLTIKDSVGGGEIDVESSYAAFFLYAGNTLTIEGGKIVYTASGAAPVINNTAGTFIMTGGDISSTAFGVALFDGASASMEGGNFAAEYSVFSGNNTLGELNIDVKGGEISSNIAAIYMPNQVALNISGGTINGGVLLRMGQVTISGGTINSLPDGKGNAIDGVLSNGTKVYAYSGLVGMRDGITALAGAYSSNNATYGNSLNLTITGGEINSVNGSAIAIYDLGKIEQKVDAKISGGKFASAAEEKTILLSTLEDAGVTDLASGFGTVENQDMALSVTGGIYDANPDGYISDGYHSIRTDSRKFKVVRYAQTDVEDGAGEEANLSEEDIEKNEDALKDLAQNIVNSALSSEATGETTLDIDGNKVTVDIDKLNTAVADGKTIKTVVTAPDEDAITDYMVITLVNKMPDGASEEGYSFDISLALVVDEEIIGQITELSEPMTFAVDISNKFTAVQENVTRQFYVARIHDDVAELFADDKVVLSDDGKTIYITTDKFSAYQINYVDTVAATAAEESETAATPNTGFFTVDGSNQEKVEPVSATGQTVTMVLFASVFAAIALIGLAFRINKRETIDKK